jgi:hypothetical protein
MKGLQSETTKFVVLGVIIGAAGISIFAGACNSSLMYLVKFFQILDILGNLSKINIKFGSITNDIFEFINRLGVPVIPFLVNMSPIKPDDVKYFRRG